MLLPEQLIPNFGTDVVLIGDTLTVLCCGASAALMAYFVSFIVKELLFKLFRPCICIPFRYEMPPFQDQAIHVG